MKPQPVDASLPVELVRAFLRWNEERFARPATPITPRATCQDGDDPRGRICSGGYAGGMAEHHEPHGVDPVEAARALRSLELLREQAGEALQCVVIVGKKQSVRAYVVDGARSRPTNRLQAQITGVTRTQLYQRDG